MATKQITHDEHTHNVKTVKEEIFGIKVDDTSVERISEAFGWSDSKFDAFLETMEKFYKFQDAAEDLNEDLPQSTKISNFVDFLKSNAFKALAIKLETPNDYVMVGFVWSGVLSKLRKSYSMGLSGHDLFELLGSLSKKG